MSITPKRILSVFSLVMINVIAVDSLRTLPFSAKFGAELIFYYIACALFFFFPVGLATAELATTWPKNGGIYIWVKEAFGEKAGFLVIWLQWIYNVVWYPSVLGLVSVLIAYLFFPNLKDNELYTLVCVLSVFYLSTAVNCFGMQLSSLISTIGSLLGTLLPMCFIILLGGYWLFLDEPLGVTFTWASMLPNLTSINDLVLITAVLFGLIGLEMSAVHAAEVKQPETDYPRAIKISSIIILLSLMLSSLAIALVVPSKEMNIVTGMLQAFEVFFLKLNLAWMIPLMAGFIIIGAIAAVATWIIGPTKGLLAAASDDLLPAIFAKTSAKGAPIPILIIQALVVTVISGAYVLLPTIEAAYVILTQLAAILGLIMYVLLFAALIRLRYSQPDKVRPYKIPGNNLIVWLIGGVGIITSSGAIILGFFPPSQIEVGDSTVYQIIMILGVIVFCSPAYFIHRLHQAKHNTKIKA